ncbi:MAG: exopolysaccharide biosynthesis protein [Pseudomonadota bacterium]
MTRDPEYSNLQHMIYDLKHTINKSSDHVPFNQLLSIVGDRAYAAMLVLPALLAASPLTAIPGISFFLALLIIFVSSQMLFRRKTMWLPHRLHNMKFKKHKTLRAMSYMEKPARILDKIMRPRLLFLTGSIGESIVVFLSFLLAIVSIPAMVIPLANLVLCAAILFFAMGLLAKDGVVILIGAIIAAVPIYMIISFILST